MKVILGFIISAICTFFAAALLIQDNAPQYFSNIESMAVFLSAISFVIGIAVLYYLANENNRISTFSVTGFLFILISLVVLQGTSMSSDTLLSIAESMDGDTTSNLDQLISRQAVSNAFYMYICLYGALHIITALLLYFVSRRKAKRIGTL